MSSLKKPSKLDQLRALRERDQIAHPTKHNPDDREWDVYFLIDPRDGRPFYVGCSYRPIVRKSQHAQDSASSAWRRCQEIKAAGLEVGLKIEATFDERTKARQFEDHLFLTTKGLLNLSPNWCHEGCECAKHKRKPWEDQGISKATYFRRKRRAEGKA